MNGRTLEYSETVHSDESVITMRSGDAYFVRLPEPSSVHHQLCIIAVLWRTWLDTKDDAMTGKVEWNIVVSAMDTLTLPLVMVLASIDLELKQSGHQLLVFDEQSSPSLVGAHIKS